jgi:PAS domain S-box-containing protein
MPEEHAAARENPRRYNFIVKESVLPEPRLGPHVTIKPALARTTAAVLLMTVFWLDAVTRPGIAVPVLYVLPILVCVWARYAFEPLAAAAVASALTVLGMFVSTGAGSPSLARVNRPLELATIWSAAGMIVSYRRMKDRWIADAERASRAMAESLKGLDELRYALNQAAIVATTDHQGRITYVNDKFCEISKYSREELIGQDHRLINSGYHPKEYIRDLWRTIGRGQVWRGELRNRAKDGSIYWVDTTIVPFLDGRGKPRQYLAIRSEITERKKAEAQLRQQGALTQLGSLAAVVAHEVRNPLAGLRASLQVLESRFGPEAREREVVSAMIERIDGLNAKVEDLLLYARPKPPRLEAVDIGAILRETAESARAAVAGTCPEIAISGGTFPVTADAEMLRAALLNLTMNACQASGDAPVEIAVEADGTVCHIAVLDRGHGIPPDLREHVFEPFFTTRAGGTGLGLAIVKRLIEAQSGTIELLERPGGGTIARVTIPLARS